MISEGHGIGDPLGGGLTIANASWRSQQKVPNQLISCADMVSYGTYYVDS